MNKIASTFSHYAPMIRAEAGQSLGLDDLVAAVPSAFSYSAHGSRSERYAQIPTNDVLEGLRGEGFLPVFACQQRTRDRSKRDFAKHMIRLQHQRDIEATKTVCFTRGMEQRMESVPEIILLNSHDGSSSYQLLAGAFRFVCCNGLVTGDVAADIRVRHQGNIIDNVIEGVYEVVRTTMEAEEHREAMRSLELDNFAQREFARAALAVRYGNPDDGAHHPISVDQVLIPRRMEDSDMSLWTTFNRVQENLTKGGMQARAASGRRSRTRSVNAIDGNVKLNRDLWNLAKETLETA